MSEEKIESAIKSVIAAEEMQAEAAESVAEAVVHTETAQAASVSVATAEAAAALAHTQSAMAEQQAAKVVFETQGEMEWLRQQQNLIAAQQETMQRELTATQSTLQESTAAILQALQSLTPPRSAQTLPEEAAIQIIDPIQESAGAEGQKEAQNQNPNARKPKMRVWI